MKTKQQEEPLFTGSASADAAREVEDEPDLLPPPERSATGFQKAELSLVDRARIGRQVASLFGATVTVATAATATRAVFGDSWRNRIRYASWWGSTGSRAMGLRVRTFGERPPEGALIVSNHRSYLDIFALFDDIPVSFLAKAEIRRMPVFGFAAEANGTVFVDRASPESRARSRELIRAALNDGARVGVFPEGTTSGGPGLLPFRLGTFEVAAETGAPVYPVALYYTNPEDHWFGKMSIATHFANRTARGPSEVEVHYGPRLIPQDPRATLRDARSWIDRRLAERYGFIR